jgi:type IV pilus assembly protein PilX
MKNRQYKQQRGFVLILALVMLAVLTLIGVSSMNSANIELKAAANAKQHQVAFNATQSLLEFTISKPGTNVIDYQTMSMTPQLYNGYVLAGASALSATVNYIGCGKGVGGSLEAGRGFSYNFYNVRGSASNATGTATSNQVLGVRYPSACL